MRATAIWSSLATSPSHWTRTGRAKGTQCRLMARLVGGYGLLFALFGVGGAAGADLEAAAPHTVCATAVREPAFLRIESTVEQGGVTGKTVRLIDLKSGRYRADHTLGINSGADGFDGAGAWTADAAGQVRPEEAEEARTAAIDQAYRYRWFCGAGRGDGVVARRRGAENGTPYEIITVHPVQGRTFTLRQDRRTGRLARMVEVGAFQTLTETYSDYRRVGGLELAFATRVSNGEPRFDRVEHVTSVTFPNRASVAATAFAQPPDGPPDFIFPPGLSEVSIPFRVAANLVIVEPTLWNGQKAAFILDSGGVDLLFPETAAALKLSPEGKFWGFGGGQSDFETAQTLIPGFNLAGVAFGRQIFLVYPFPDLKAAIGAPDLAGLLGYEIFKRFVVKIDYAHHVVTLTLPDRFHYKGPGSILPFRFNGNIPEVDAQIDGLPGRIHVDTGDTGTVLLYSPWSHDHGLDRGQTVQKTTGAAGGETDFTITRIGSLKLGAATFSNIDGAISLQRTGALSNPYGAGLVGSGLFQGKTVIFDYSRRQLIIE